MTGYTIDGDSEDDMQTRIHFIEELGRLNHDILAMGTRVEEGLRKALEALKRQTSSSRARSRPPTG